MGGRVAISRFYIGSIWAFAAAHFGATLFAATVRAERQAFDRRMLQVRHLAGPATDPTLLTPLTLMTAEFRDHVTADVFHRTPFLRPEPGEGELFGPAAQHRTGWETKMGRIFSGVLATLVYLSVLLLLPIAGSVWLMSHTADNRLAFYLPLWACLLLAVITPFSIIAIRTQVRLTRIRMIDLFADLFKIQGTRTGSGMVSFDFVRGKYVIDLPDRGGNQGAEDVPRFPMLLHADWMLLFCTIP